jgi:nitrite reductase/ring-hydroxylating ferredoxin subunit
LQTGEPQSLPATRPVPVYDVELDGDEIVVVVRT